jgi:hypothetical protein
MIVAPALEANGFCIYIDKKITSNMKALPIDLCFKIFYLMLIIRQKVDNILYYIKNNYVFINF